MISTNSNFSLSSVLQAYADGLSAKAAAAIGKAAGGDGASGGASATATSTSTATTPGETTATNTAAKTATSTAAAPSSFKTTAARQTLDQTQQQLAKALREAVAKAGGSIHGEVAFSLNSSSGLTITGSAEDKATIAAALKADAGSPSLASRLASLTKSAVTLESNSRASTAISQAARYAKTPAAVMSLYNTLMAQQGSTSATAVFTLSDKASSLTYKGMVDTSA